MNNQIHLGRRLVAWMIVASIIVFAGCGPKAPVSTPLHDAVMTDDAAKVQAAIAATPGGVEALNADKETPLIVAAKNGATQSAKALLDAGANISYKDTYGYTPLHWAAYKGQLSTAQLLVDRHADVNAVDLDTRNPADAGRQGAP